MRPASFAWLLLFVATTSTTLAQEGRRRADYPPEMPGAKAVTYKTIGDTKLNLFIYEPAGLNPGEQRPAIVLFFGGGWTNGSPRQFLQQCKYFASRGMVAIAADYRVASRHQVKAVDCVRDAKSAIRYLRAHAKELHVDPERIAAGGGSAGGHLAAAIGTIDGLDEDSEAKAISSCPNALLLYNPALVLATIEGVEVDASRLSGLKDRLGIEPNELSPYHHVAAGDPPTVIFHGTADKTVPHATAAAFERAMKAAGNACTLHSYEGEGHGFFNYGRGDGTKFVEVLTASDRFLAGLGYLKGESTVEEFLKTTASE
jgi:acetyl esterase/lipase